MSVGEEKTFVMQHVFTDVMNLRHDHYGPQERYFGVLWNLSIFGGQSGFDVNFNCLGTKSDEKWSIDTTITLKLLKKDIEEIVVKKVCFSKKGIGRVFMKSGSHNGYLKDGNLNILECKVTIHEMTGIKIPIEKRVLRSFDDESAEELSDIVLVVNDQKFHGSKVYLASQSTYFKSLLFGNFDESKQSEVELKDIDPYDFQKFLEVLYSEPAINDANIEGILKLADMYDAKAVIRQCEFFYLRVSEQDLVSKFTTALKYNMNQLKNKCISEIKSVEEIKEVIAENDGRIDHPTTKKLLKMSIDFYEKK